MARGVVARVGLGLLHAQAMLVLELLDHRLAAGATEQRADLGLQRLGLQVVGIQLEGPRHFLVRVLQPELRHQAARRLDVVLDQERALLLGERQAIPLVVEIGLLPLGLRLRFRSLVQEVGVFVLAGRTTGDGDQGQTERSDGEGPHRRLFSDRDVIGGPRNPSYRSRGRGLPSPRDGCRQERASSLSRGVRPTRRSSRSTGKRFERWQGTRVEGGTIPGSGKTGNRPGQKQPPAKQRLRATVGDPEGTRSRARRGPRTRPHRGRFARAESLLGGGSRTAASEGARASAERSAARRS